MTGNSSLALAALAHKRGMVAYQWAVPEGGRLPDYAERRKIEHQVAKSVHEHLIPTLEAIKRLHSHQIFLPARERDRPDRDRLAVRFEIFEARI